MIPFVTWHCLIFLVLIDSLFPGIKHGLVERHSSQISGTAEITGSRQYKVRAGESDERLP